MKTVLISTLVVIIGILLFSFSTDTSLYSQEKSIIVTQPGQDIDDGGAPTDELTADPADNTPSKTTEATTETPSEKTTQPKDESDEEVKQRIIKERELFNRYNVLKVGNVTRGKQDNRFYATSNTGIYVTCKETEDELNSGVAAIDVQIDGGPVTTHKGNKTGLIYLKEEGEHELAIRATDNVGNQSPRQVHKVVIDNSAPFIFVNFKIDPNFPEKQYVKVDNTIVTPLIQKEIIHLPRCHRIYCTAVDMGVGISKKEPDYGIEVSLDGNQYQFYDADPEKGGVKIPTAGLHVLKFRTRDLLGNTSEPLVFNVFVDVITPVFFITPKYGKLIFFPPLEVDDECAEPIPPVPAPPADPQQPPAVPKAPIQPPELKIKEWEGMVGFEFYLKKRMYLPGASYLLKDFEKIESEDQPSGKDSDANKENAKDGQTVQYSGEAVVNNEKFDVGSLYEDVQGNKVFTYLPGVKNEFKITGMDPSGVPEILIRVDRGTWDVYKGAISFYTNGVHVLDIKAIDGVGNVSYGRQKIFIDNIPPSTNIQPESNKGGLNVGDTDITPRGATNDTNNGTSPKNNSEENIDVLDKTSDEKE